MNRWRVSSLTGLVAALIADVYAYQQFGQLRDLVTHEHWIFYLYVGVMAAIAVGGGVYLGGLLALAATRTMGITKTRSTLDGEG